MPTFVVKKSESNLGYLGEGSTSSKATKGTKNDNFRFQEITNHPGISSLAAKLHTRGAICHNILSARGFTTRLPDIRLSQARN
jgi:hypothetical protein